MCRGHRGKGGGGLRNAGSGGKDGAGCNGEWDEELRGLAVPKKSHALRLRSGVLFCSTEATCEFVLTPHESANMN
jgi:hypothetical protein